MNNFGTIELISKRTFIILLATLALFLIPFMAMQFTSEVSWTYMDFIAASLLLFGLGLLVDFILRKISKPRQRIYLIIGILTIFVALWVELAVGIFGSPLVGN
jgi:uncharacterized membrane protein